MNIKKLIIVGLMVVTASGLVVFHQRSIVSGADSPVITAAPVAEAPVTPQPAPSQSVSAPVVSKPVAKPVSKPVAKSEAAPIQSAPSPQVTQAQPVEVSDPTDYNQSATGQPIPPPDGYRWCDAFTVVPMMGGACIPVSQVK